jgi:hypothetical protein
MHEAPPATCHHWAVTVWRTGPQVTVELADGQGLTVVRRVSDMQVAAAVVDSWLHQGLLPAPAPVPIQDTQVATAVAAAPLAAPVRDPLTLTVGPEAVAGSDGSRWWGGHVDACAALGPFCAGAIVQGQAGAAIVGDPGTTRRYTGDLLAALHLPVAVGAVRVVPGVGVGLGVLQANTSDPGPNMPGEITGARNATTWALRTSARLALAIPIGRHLGLDIGGALDTSLPARGAASDGQGGAYPAEPRFFLRGGIALRYGLP